MIELLKKIGKVIFITLGSLILVAVVLIFFTLISHKDEVDEKGSVSINFSGDGSMLNFEKPEPIYADTMEEALLVNADYYFSRYPYMSKVSDIIKIFENENYASLFYHTEGGVEPDGFVASKFMVRTINGKKQYALIMTDPGTIGGKWREKPSITARESAPLYDFLSEFGIDEEERFIFGSLGTEKVKTLKIEGQSPTEVIEYTVKGKKEYFWYYENLISDKPSAEFDIEMDE